MLLERVTYSANDDLDSVVLRIGDMQQRVGYRVGFAIDQSLRVAAKHVAEYYGAKASFWRELALTSLDDCPKPHRSARQSRHTPTYREWSVEMHNPPLVALLFDGAGEEFDIDVAVSFGHEIRRASRRAKAWAGDTSSDRRLIAHITDANAEPSLRLA